MLTELNRHSKSGPLLGVDMKKQNLIGEQDVVKAFADFTNFVMTVEGPKPLFKGFKINDRVKEIVVAAREEFVEGLFATSMKKLALATSLLEDCLRKYAANSISQSGFFDRITAGLPILDLDLTLDIESKRKDFDLIATSRGVSLEELSKRYWVLLDAINMAPRTQLARNETKATEKAAAKAEDDRNKIIARKARQIAEAAAATERNRKRDAEKRQRRQEVIVTDLADLGKVLGISL